MFMDRDTRIYNCVDKILVSHLMLYNFYKFMNALFCVMISFEVYIMQLVLIWKGLITIILKPGATSLLKRWGRNFTCWDHCSHQ